MQSQSLLCYSYTHRLRLPKLQAQPRVVSCCCLYILNVLRFHEQITAESTVAAREVLINLSLPEKSRELNPRMLSRVTPWLPFIAYCMGSSSSSRCLPKGLKGSLAQYWPKLTRVHMHIYTHTRTQAPTQPHTHTGKDAHQPIQVLPCSVTPWVGDAAL